MLVTFSPIFVADTKINYDCDFVAPLTLALDKEVWYENVALLIVVLSTKKWYISFFVKGFSFSENFF